MVRGESVSITTTLLLIFAAWIVISCGVLVIRKLRLIRRSKERLIELKSILYDYQTQCEISGLVGDDEFKAMMQIQNEMWNIQRFLKHWRHLAKLVEIKGGGE